MMRAVDGQLSMAMTSTIFVSDGAEQCDDQDRQEELRHDLERFGDAHERLVDLAAGEPASAPMTTPRTADTAAAATPTRSDTRAPLATRASMSRPRSSVPKRHSRPGETECAAGPSPRASR